MKKLKLITILVIAFVMNAVVFAEDSVYQTITIDEATEKAIEYSKNLKALSESSVLAQEGYEAVHKDYILASEALQLLNLVGKLQESVNKLSNIKANQETEKESIRVNVTNFFFNVLKAEEELELYKENLSIVESELKIAKAKKDLGLISETEYASQKASYDKLSTDIFNKELSIKTAYRSLNNVLGSNVNTKYNLILDDEYLTFSTIEDGTTLSEYIYKGLSASNNLTQLKQNVETAKYQVAIYSSVVNTSSLQSVEITYAQAQRAFEEARTKLEQDITDLYNSILSAENNYKTKLKDISEQENSIKILEVKYSLGNATELEVKKAKYQLEVLNLELQQIIFDHNISKIKLKNVNLM